MQLLHDGDVYSSVTLVCEGEMASSPGVIVVIVIVIVIIILAVAGAVVCYVRRRQGRR